MEQICNLKRMVDYYETTLMRRALNAVGWNRTGAADILGIPRTTLQDKMQEAGLADHMADQDPRDDASLDLLLNELHNFYRETEITWLARYNEELRKLRDEIKQRMGIVHANAEQTAAMLMAQGPKIPPEPKIAFDVGFSGEDLAARVDQLIGARK